MNGDSIIAHVLFTDRAWRAVYQQGWKVSLPLPVSTRVAPVTVRLPGPASRSTSPKPA